MDSSNKFTLPKPIEGLGDLADNLWWSWHPLARSLFKRLDRALWKSTGHNPVMLLKKIPYHRLVACAEDANYLGHYNSVLSDFRNDMRDSRNWFQQKYPEYQDNLIAYFSLEFAIHNSLPLYAGGLGVLAGDYCKQASDLGLPLVGVGLMYPQGYFHQYISQDGRQTEVYDQLNFNDVAISRLYASDSKLITVQVPLDNISIQISSWVLNVGRIKLYLLDTNLEGNPQLYRRLSGSLYGGDREMRLLQEMVIGIGGVRMLRALGLKPSVWHANEGHTSFMMIERMCELVQAGFSYQDAMLMVQSGSVFTTHTPVPAGNDTFSPDLVEKYFHSYWGKLGISRDEFMKLGVTPTDPASFNMTALGLRLSNYRNGVSKLHGRVCRKMWHSLWPDLPEDEVPIDAVTNGVHASTWVAPQFHILFDLHIGNDWLRKQEDTSIWDKIQNIPDEQIWAMHRWLKLKLITSILDRARKRWSYDKVAPVQPLAMGALLDTETLTVGFCRRFTGYKRASLIFNDIEKLKYILIRELQPVQIIFAGKAHPNDEEGKRLIQQVYNIAKDPQFVGRIAFVEDYDMHIARDLISGVDLWLNTPRKLLEASGTSGQKASMNGVPNLSVLDGWWYEGYNGNNGWAIEEDIDQGGAADIDCIAAGKIYELLEKKIVPLFYERDLNGIPHGWIQLMKETIRSNTPYFNAHRMAREYTERYYLSASRNSRTEGR